LASLFSFSFFLVARIESADQGLWRVSGKRAKREGRGKKESDQSKKKRELDPNQSRKRKEAFVNECHPVW